MQPVQPIYTVDLFAPLLDALLELLRRLSPDDWRRPTACSGWTVKDVALHLLGDDIGILSRQRDGFRPATRPVERWTDLVDLINWLNESWVQAAQRISERLLVDLLAFTGTQATDHFASLDLAAIGAPVSWAGSGAAPVWLDVAREYTERWHHQQHIRDAVGQPDLTNARFLAPVLATFVHSLPHTLRDIAGADGDIVGLTVRGPAGGRWFVCHLGGRWQLAGEVQGPLLAEVVMEEDTAWRFFTKGLTQADLAERTQIAGVRAAGEAVLTAVAIIA